tara:strand:+ start:1265 stop:1567 length:303 start_codon:yes stop_codon:yes gene_type:complete
MLSAYDILAADHEICNKNGLKSTLDTVVENANDAGRRALQRTHLKQRLIVLKHTLAHLESRRETLEKELRDQRLALAANRAEIARLEAELNSSFPPTTSP